MAQNNQNPFEVNTSGAFADYLGNSYVQPAQQQPQATLSGQEGKGTRVAFYLDQFLKGAQRGRYKAQERELMHERQTDNTINQFLVALNDKDPVQAEQIRSQIMTERGKQAMSMLEGADKKKGKDGQDDKHKPVLGMLKNFGEAMLGGKVEKFKGYGDNIGKWAVAINSMPSKTDAEKRDNQQFQTLVQQRIGAIQKDNPGREVYREDLVQDPKLRTGAAMYEKAYGSNPLDTALAGYRPKPGPIERFEEGLFGGQGQNQGAAPAVAGAPSTGQPAGGGAGQAPPSGAGPTKLNPATLAPLIKLGFATQKKMDFGDKRGVEVYQVNAGPNFGTYTLDGTRIPNEVLAQSGHETLSDTEKAEKANKEWDRRNGVQQKALDRRMGRRFEQQKELVALGQGRSEDIKEKDHYFTVQQGYSSSMRKIQSDAERARAGALARKNKVYTAQGSTQQQQTEADAAYAKELNEINKNSTEAGKQSEIEYMDSIDNVKRIYDGENSDLGKRVREQYEKGKVVGKDPKTGEDIVLKKQYPGDPNFPDLEEEVDDEEEAEEEEKIGGAIRKPDAPKNSTAPPTSTGSKSAAPPGGKPKVKKGDEI